MSEWNEKLKVFWQGGNGCEYIAWKGSHQVFVYPGWEHPAPPSEVIQHTKRIETLEDFDDALDNGKHLNVEYKELGSDWKDPKVMEWLIRYNEEEKRRKEKTTKLAIFGGLVTVVVSWVITYLFI